VLTKLDIYVFIGNVQLVQINVAGFSFGKNLAFKYFGF
jgi:hypothetical protein